MSLGSFRSLLSLRSLVALSSKIPLVKLLLPLLLLALAGPASAASASSEPALRLEAGSVTQQQIVSLGRDVSIEGEALSDIAALNGSVDVSGRVEGEVIVLR